MAPDKRVDQNRVELLLRQFDEAVTELRFMGYSDNDLSRRIREGGKHS